MYSIDFQVVAVFDKDCFEKLLFFPVAPVAQMDRAVDF
jgi:hypothetical protein